MSEPKRSARARRSEAVAQEAPTAAAERPASTAPARAADAVAVKRCCSGRVVYRTDGVATEPVEYCKRHLPANVTRDMLRLFKP